jgi:ribosome maturation factor RimP
LEIEGANESPLVFCACITPVEKRIEQLTEEFFKGTDQFLVEIKVNKGNQVQIFADSDSGMTIEKCVMLNRFLEKQLNTEMPFSENYSLEVSSPGMDQPFKVFRQYLKNKNRDVEILMNDGQKWEGKMIETDENKIQLEIIRKEKNKIMDSKIVDIKFSDIKNAYKAIHF